MQPSDPHREANIAAAIQAIRDQTPGCESISKAAAVYKIPKETLRRRVHGTQNPVADNGGGNKLLNDTQETALVSYLRRSTEMGFPLSIAMISDAAQSLLRNAGSDAKVGNNWPSRFLFRYPEFNLRRPGAAALTPRRTAAERAEALGDRIEETEQKITAAEVESLRAKAAMAQLKADRAILKSLKASEKALKAKARVVEAEASLAQGTPVTQVMNGHSMSGEATPAEQLRGEQNQQRDGGAGVGLSILDDWP